MLEHVRLLPPHMGRQEQPSLASMVGSELSAPAVELFDDDLDVLEAKVGLCLDEVVDGPRGRIPREQTVHERRWAGLRAEPSCRHPPVEENLVRAQWGIDSAGHVQDNIVFINNEQALKMNSEGSVV